MKYLMPILLLLLFASCSDKEDDISQDLPDCMESEIEMTPNLKRILVQNINGEPHYWLNTDLMHLDGIEYIVNDNCEEVCSIGGLLPPPECTNDYPQEEWTVIWEN